MTEATTGHEWAEELSFDINEQARMHGEYLGMPKSESESESNYRQRIAGELRRNGQIIEAHEALSGRRWDDSEQGQLGPVAGIAGALAQMMNGHEYSPHDPERQVGDDIAAGIVALSGQSQSDMAIGALFDLLGPEQGMNVIDAFYDQGRERL